MCNSECNNTAPRLPICNDNSNGCLLVARFPKWLTKRRTCGIELANDEIRALSYPSGQERELPGLNNEQAWVAPATCALPG